MATLTDDEIARCRSECYDHLLTIGAEPYIGFHPIWNTVRDNVVSSSVAATSSTTVVSTAPAMVSITLADSTGLAIGDKVVIGADDDREVCTIMAIAGNAITVKARKNHGVVGSTLTYPVEKDSALTIVRGILADLSRLELSIADAMDTGGIKRVDEVEFFGPNDGGSHVDQLLRNQRALRMELARRLGLGPYVAAKAPGGSSYEQY